MFRDGELLKEFVVSVVGDDMERGQVSDARDSKEQHTGVELVISEPRQPCFKLAAHMGFKHAVKMMAQSGYCGFYLAVKREGSIAAGESFELIEGPREVGIHELFKAKMRKHA